ncbi:hypothetical protein LJC45_04570 [Alistipes sp. OttesenSCG-928-B03]|nr:hypothetical protein [Alistipes sp. OttesenSCG-928-B03]
MKRYDHIKYSLAVILLAMGCMTATAQESITPAALELYKQRSLWRQSTNAAGSLLDNPWSYAQLEAGYKMTDGSFHRPQQGKEENNLSFYTEGGRTLSGFYAWGSFAYDRETIHDANYNVSLADPYRNMPYYLVDINPSKWLNQHYNLNFRLTTLRLCDDRLILGMEGTYKTTSAAKQRDMRTMNRYMLFGLKPGIVYSTTPKYAYSSTHTFGLNFEYYMLKEEGNMTSINEDKQIYYIHRGLGVADYYYGNPNRTTNYMGNNVGGGVQYHYNGTCFELLASANYSYKVEDVENGYSEAKPLGTVRDHLWQGRIMFQTKKHHITHHLDLKYTDRNIDGIEYLTEYNNEVDPPVWEKVFSSVRSQYKTQTAEAVYSLAVNRGQEYNWKFDARASYYKQDDEYKLPISVMQTENMAFSLDAKKNFAFGNSMLLHRLLVTVGGSYNTNLSGKYEYNGPNAGYHTVSELFPQELAFLTSDFYHIGGSVTYSQRISKNNEANMYARITYKYAKAIDSTDYDKRTSLSFSLGCNF